MKNKHDTYGGCLMLIFIFIIAAIIGCTLFGCQKEQLPPTVANVSQWKKVYNNTTEWRYLRTDLVKDFGLIRHPDLQFYLDQQKDTVQLCIEPVKLFWKITF